MYSHFAAMCRLMCAPGKVSEESDNLLSLRRICCASKEEGDVIPVPMAWELK